MGAPNTTPGPWAHGHAGNTRLWVGPAYDKQVVALVPWDDDSARPEARANVTLLAAAPDLYAQREFAVKLRGGFPAMSGTAQVEAMRAALARARQDAERARLAALNPQDAT